MMERPSVDIHEWNIENVYRGLGTRTEIRQGYFLSQPGMNDRYLSELTTAEIIDKYWDGSSTNPFGRNRG